MQMFIYVKNRIYMLLMDDKNAALEITEMFAYLGTYAVLTCIYTLIYIYMYADVYLCINSYIYALNG
jgi:hypothetical protein